MFTTREAGHTRRALLVAMLLLAAVAQSGCDAACTATAREWGVAGCGETQTLNRAPELRNYRQSDLFPEVGRQVFFHVTARDADGDALTFEWDFEGDGHIDDATTYPAWLAGAFGRADRRRHLRLPCAGDRPPDRAGKRLPGPAGRRR